jgi:outer membrane protein
MKKLLLLSAIAVFGLSNVNAQEEAEKTFGFEKGNIILEGGLNFGSSTEEQDGFETKTSDFNFSPKAGYFINDKFAVGVELAVGSGKVENTFEGQSVEDKISSFSAGVFARYYFLDLGKRFKTFAEAGVGFGSSTLEEEGIEEDLETSGFGIGVDLGINYFVTENFAIVFGLADVLSYSSTTTERGEFESDTNSFNGNLNVFNNFFDTARFGVTWKF